MIASETGLCCVIGNPVKHSLSPVMFNAGFAKLGLDFVYLAFEIDKLELAISGLKQLHFKGISVTIPFKKEVMKYLDKIDETAQIIGAVNTIVNNDGYLIGYNTDWIGAVKALEEITVLKGKKVALLGAGGAARAVAYGLKTKMAKVQVYNRTKSKADRLKHDLELDNSYSLHNSETIKGADIIINTTSVGMIPDNLNCPIPAELIRKNQIVFDIVYSPFETRLLQIARARNAKIIQGYKMLLYQGVEQFKLFTGIEAPKKVMEEALLKVIKLT